MEESHSLDIFEFLSDMVVGTVPETDSVGAIPGVTLQTLPLFSSETFCEQADDVAEESPQRKHAVWEIVGTTSSLVDSLSRLLARLVSSGFQMPWTCSTCLSTNTSYFSCCEVCKTSNDAFAAAVAADLSSCGAPSSDCDYHILLELARCKGFQEIEACFALCEAMACELHSPQVAVLQYSRAFKLWTELDSPMCADGVPRKLRSEADELLKTCSKPSGLPDICPILGAHRSSWPQLFLDKEEKRERLLKSFDVRGIAQYVVEQSARRIVVMCGAGISTSAGISDFRSPGTGLYDNLQKYNLERPEDMFSLQFFEKRPAAFYELVQELWPGSYAPTPCHFFIRLLHEKGLLLRCYTQNIDSLESEAGLPSDKLVAVHGNFDQAHVINTEPEELVDINELKAAIELGEPGWKDLQARKGGLVKPKIVFFGEAMPERFCALHSQDLATCDLLLVLGTSLSVSPFCDLLAKANPDAPRLLINRDPVGLCRQLHGGFRFDLEGQGENWRDAFYKGDIDDGVFALASALGWLSDLNVLLEQLPSLG